MSGPGKKAREERHPGTGSNNKRTSNSRGVDAFGDADVQQALNLSDDQKEKIREIINQHDKRRDDNYEMAKKWDKEMYASLKDPVAKGVVLHPQTSRHGRPLMRGYRVTNSMHSRGCARS